MLLGTGEDRPSGDRHRAGTSNGRFLRHEYMSDSTGLGRLIRRDGQLQLIDLPIPTLPSGRYST